MHAAGGLRVMHVPKSLSPAAMAGNQGSTQDHVAAQCATFVAPHWAHVKQQHHFFLCTHTRVPVTVQQHPCQSTTIKYSKARAAGTLHTDDTKTRTGEPRNSKFCSKKLSTPNLAACSPAQHVLLQKAHPRIYSLYSCNRHPECTSPVRSSACTPGTSPCSHIPLRPLNYRGA